MSIILIFSSFLLFSTAHALFFDIGETEKKCFFEDIPDETIVVGKYRVEFFDKQQNAFIQSPPGLGMHVEVKDPDEKTILSRTYATEGRFTFSSATPGEHEMCLYANSTAWFGGGILRVHLTISVGERANDYQLIASRDNLSELELRVRQLLDQVDQIGKEQNYQRNREEKFREMSDSTNQRVLWWSASQSFLLLVIGLWQMHHLRRFFEAKKLV